MSRHLTFLSSVVGSLWPEARASRNGWPCQDLCERLDPDRAEDTPSCALQTDDSAVLPVNHRVDFAEPCPSPVRGKTLDSTGRQSVVAKCAHTHTFVSSFVCVCLCRAAPFGPRPHPSRKRTRRSCRSCRWMPRPLQHCPAALYPLRSVALPPHDDMVRS